MEVASLCLIISTLSINPDRSQFFEYERISLSCAGPGNSTGWTLKRNVSFMTSQPCKGGFGYPYESVCTIMDADPLDNGVYWCESEQGECSKPINITVTAGVVILESPALPVTEGDNVTLRCIYKARFANNPTSDFNATFYKDGEFFGTEPAGKMILSSVSKHHEGLYRCKHPEKGQSEQSWLSVTGQPSNVSPPPHHLPLMLVCTILLFILYTAILILAIYTYRKCARARADVKKRASDQY
ncbi:low affinity immunoglobulin gamma Fc region receptor II-like isoform X2 [Sparus aurata]|uniref:low affinity immunoglobulin gamma Fc region receptor II-like isoform X2 n=1 Tax=Sparus aurata TaxID=8175 RepID=UPI0011C1120F|nr:low affinity immunoglobulin gamma Fc region receptor II-like isoform X2 [Sparus aurata]